MRSRIALLSGRNTRCLDPKSVEPVAVLIFNRAFESAIQSTLIRLNDEHSHTEFDPYTFHPSQLAKCPRQCYTSKLGLLDHTDALGTFHTGPPSTSSWKTKSSRTSTSKPSAKSPSKWRWTSHHHRSRRSVRARHQYSLGYKSRANWYRFTPPIERHLDRIYLYMKALGASQGQIVYLAKSDLEVRTWPPESTHRCLRSRSRARSGPPREGQAHRRRDYRRGLPDERRGQTLREVRLLALREGIPSLRPPPGEC